MSKLAKFASPAVLAAAGLLQLGSNALYAQSPTPLPASALHTSPRQSEVPMNPYPPGTTNGLDLFQGPHGPYLADLQRRIKRAWFPPKGNEDKCVLVTFKVAKNGQMTGLALKTSSGMAIADSAAMKAVENAAPFRPLPEDQPTPIQVDYLFDYGHGNGGGRATIRFDHH